jgi:hypothetical protein
MMMFRTQKEENSISVIIKMRLLKKIIGKDLIIKRMNRKPSLHQDELLNLLKINNLVQFFLYIFLFNSFKTLKLLILNKINKTFNIKSIIL